MSQYSRNGFRWNVNECIQLQREFELLELTIDKIAERHKRTPKAIMFKLDQEGFSDYNLLYNYNTYYSTKYQNRRLFSIFKLTNIKNDYKQI